MGILIMTIGAGHNALATDEVVVLPAILCRSVAWHSKHPRVTSWALE
jgi:hypothetical protein